MTKKSRRILICSLGIYLRDCEKHEESQSGELASRPGLISDISKLKAQVSATGHLGRVSGHRLDPSQGTAPTQDECGPTGTIVLVVGFDPLIQVSEQSETLNVIHSVASRANITLTEMRSYFVSGIIEIGTFQKDFIQHR
jgi:hypothetical protein